jgi:hypothetical protein
MQLVKLKVTGVGSILMHNPESMRGGDDAGVLQRGGKKIPPPYEEAKAGLYVLPNGQLYIKSDAFREAGLIASSDIRDPTRKGRTTMTRRFSASVFLVTEYCLLYRPEGKPITNADEDWEIDRRRVVVQKNGILRARPKISQWACIVEFEYDEGTIDPNLIMAVMAQAGKYPGVLDYRVGKKGPFGRFTAELANGFDFTANGKEKKGAKS